MRCVKCGEPVKIEDGQPVHRGHGTSEWMLRVETVTDGYRGTELDGQIETADSSAPLPRVDDWFKLVPMTTEEVLDELHKAPNRKGVRHENHCLNDEPGVTICTCAPLVDPPKEEE